MVGFGQAVSDGAEPTAAPPGVTVWSRGQHLRIDLTHGGNGRLVAVVAWAATSLLLLLDRLQPNLLGLGTADLLGRREWLVLWALGTGLCVGYLLSRTIVYATPGFVRVLNVPWFFPAGCRIATPDIRYAQTATHTDASADDLDDDAAANETFLVQVTRFSTPEHSTLLVTTDEDQAVFVRKCLQWYLSRQQRAAAR